MNEIIETGMLSVNDAALNPHRAAGTVPCLGPEAGLMEHTCSACSAIRLANETNFDTALSGAPSARLRGAAFVA